MSFASIGIQRLRIGRDGDGVTTLIGGFSCPLDCKYCLNPHCKSAKYIKRYSCEELYDEVKLDSLYFEATNGGICFGGGEPLLQSEFIARFIEFVREKGHGWRFFIETSLAVGIDISPLLPLVDGWIVDIKDMNPEIYSSYTGKSPDNMLEKLELLRGCADRVVVRIPLIPSFNTGCDCDASEKRLTELGFRNFDRFTYTIRAD